MIWLELQFMFNQKWMMMFSKLPHQKRNLIAANLVALIELYHLPSDRSLLAAALDQQLEEADRQGWLSKSAALLYVQLLTNSPSIRASVQAHRQSFVVWLDTNPPLDSAFMGKIRSLETFKYGPLVKCTPIWNAVAQADEEGWTAPYTSDEFTLLEMFDF